MKSSKSKSQKSKKPIVYLVVVKQDHDTYYDIYSDKEVAIKKAKKSIKNAIENYGFTDEEEKTALLEYTQKTGRVYAAFLENDSVEVFEQDIL